MTPRRKDIAMLLAARAAGAAQVSTLIAERMRPDVLLPNDALPAATYEVVSTEEWAHLQGMQGEGSTRVQFNCYALSRETANKVAYAIRDVLAGWSGTLTHDDLEYAQVHDCIPDNRYTRREPDEAGSNAWRYRTVIDFEVTHSEPVPTLTPE